MKWGFLAGVVVALSSFSAFAQQYPYGQSRGWSTVAEFGNGQFLGCGAQINRDGGFWAIALDAQGQWQLVFGAPGNHGQRQVAIDIDRATLPWNVADGDGTNVYIPLDWNGVQRVRAGNWMTISVTGGASGTFSLAGTAAAIAKVQECVQNRGQPPAQGAAPQPYAAAPARPAPAVENDALRGGHGCPDFRAWASLASDQPATLQVTNRTDRAVTLYWIDFSGVPQDYAGVLPGESQQMVSYAGHRWLARDFGGSCIGGVFDLAPGFNGYELR